MEKMKTPVQQVTMRYSPDYARLAYKLLIKKRGQFRNFNSEKFEKVAKVAKEHGVSVIEWISVQFSMLDCGYCRFLYKSPIPPVSALSGPRAVYRWRVFRTEKVVEKEQEEYLKKLGAEIEMHRACGEI